MLKILLCFSIVIVMTSSLILMNILIMKNFTFSTEKNSPFECGFNNFKSSRLPFSVNFFIISIIFLIFDVEITLIMPLIPSFNFINLYTWFNSISCLFFILILGMFIEWKDNSLNWVY
uniref:NADH-ubiquinone oxidoreductase chain 3 n=1 Tax=Parevania sp. ZJUH_2016024 TaxID=2491165 RepID=A0A3Q8UAA2_9HYME|nr:NADH dehydrogenase subunit 3 [Parevania sp. ZJUH_2016024]